MTSTYHTPITTGAAANAATFNTPFSQLDSRLVQIDNAVDTDGSLRAGAVDDTGILVDSVVTSAKIANATITGAKLVTGTVTATQIADTTITNGKIANATITDAKLAYPVRVAWAQVGIATQLASVSAHSTSDTVWDFGLAGNTAANFVVVNRDENTAVTPGIIWDAWIEPSTRNVIIRASNFTAGTVNIAEGTNLIVAVFDVRSDMAETTETFVP